VSVVWVLLEDPRVDLSFPEKKKSAPLRRAADDGQYEVIEWLIASGRDLGDFNEQHRLDGGIERTALGIARMRKHTEVVLLLERFVTNPAQTRLELRRKLVPDELAAEVFAVMIFLCDGLL